MLTCSVFAAQLQAAGAPLPRVVAAQVQALVASCREVDGKPELAGLVQRADLNGDGREDYVVDVAGMVCVGAWSVFGDRAKDLSVYAGDGRGGAALAFSEPVFGTRLEPAPRGTQLWLTVMGQACGQPAARDFASERFCERPLRWNARTGRFDYAPLSMARMLR